MTREEAADWIDDLAFDPDLGEERLQEAAKEIAPGNREVEELLHDLHQTFFVDDHVLEYYADRLYRIANHS